jgi:hypothetical protein
MTSWIQKIEIENNTNLSHLNLRNDVFVDNKLKFYIDNNGYQPISEGNGATLMTTGSGSFLDASYIRRGFTTAINYPEYNLYVAICLIAKNAIAQKTPIRIIDWLSPEMEDYATGCTSRLGFIKVPVEKSGSVVDPDSATRYLPEGFRITFMESRLRII